MAQPTIDPRVLQALAAGQDIGQYGYTTSEHQPGQWQGGDAGSFVNSGPAQRLLVQGIDNSSANIFDEQGNFLGVNSGDSDGRALGKFITTALAMYAGGQALGGGAGGASGGSAAGTAGGLVSLTPAEIAATNAAATAGLDAGVAGLSAVDLGAGTVAATGSTTAGLSTLGSGGASGGYTTAAADSQLANSTLGLSSTNVTPAAVNLTNAGGTMTTGTTGWDLLSNAATSQAGIKLLTTAAGALVADKAADALAPNPDTSKLDQLLSTYLTEMGKTSARADDQWANYLTTFRPLETKMAETALGYDTPARREAAANEAMGGVASQYDVARTTGLRDLQAAGADPSTIAALGTASLLDEAKSKAGAGNAARSDVENKGLSLVSNAAQFGRQLPNSSAGLSSVATGQGNSAVNAANSANTATTNATNSKNDLFGDLLGAGLKAWGMYNGTKGG